jgi:hypothetical protein
MMQRSNLHAEDERGQLFKSVITHEGLVKRIDNLSLDPSCSTRKESQVSTLWSFWSRHRFRNGRFGIWGRSIGDLHVASTVLLLFSLSHSDYDSLCKAFQLPQRTEKKH